MERIIEEKEEKIRILESKLEECQENENAILARYTKEIEELNVELEQERKSAKEGLVALAELGKSQEEMFSSSIYEVENLMKTAILGNSKGDFEELELSTAEMKRSIPKSRRLTRNVTSLTKEPEKLKEIASTKQVLRKKTSLTRVAQPRFTKRGTQ
jgi:hypothetical protein